MKKFCSTLPVLDYELVTVINVWDWLETKIILLYTSMELARLSLTEIFKKI